MTAHHWTPEGHDPLACVPCLQGRIEGLVWVLALAHQRLRELEQELANGRGQRDGLPV